VRTVLVSFTVLCCGDIGLLVYIDGRGSPLASLCGSKRPSLGWLEYDANAANLLELTVSKPL
jgi:hypothetical protein